MLQTFYDLSIKSIISYDTPIILFNFIASRINKKIIFKNYQKKIQYSKVMLNTLFLDKINIDDYKILYKKKYPSTILNFLMIDFKTTFRLINQEKMVNIIFFNLGSKFLFKFINVSCKIKVQAINPSAHLMFFDLLWIMNVQYQFAPAPIPSGSATHQGTLSYVYSMCTLKYYGNMYVLHTSGTSSATAQTETSLKIYLSISETVFEHGRFLIRLDSIFISTYFKTCKISNRLNFLSFQKANGEQISCFSLNLPILLSLKFVCKHPLSTFSFYKKFKLGIFKRILTISHELMLIKSNVLIIYLQKPYKNTLDLLNLIFFKCVKAYKRSFFSIISITVLITNNNVDI